jgi:hypothetical protein
MHPLLASALAGAGVSTCLAGIHAALEAQNEPPTYPASQPLTYGVLIGLYSSAEEAKPSTAGLVPRRLLRLLGALGYIVISADTNPELWVTTAKRPYGELFASNKKKYNKIPRAQYLASACTLGVQTVSNQNIPVGTEQIERESDVLPEVSMGRALLR